MNWRRVLLRSIIGVALLGVVAYAADSVVVRARPERERFDVVQINNYLLVPLKGGKMQFDLAGTADETCARALFPQLGRSPCWYLRWRSERWQEI